MFDRFVYRFLYSQRGQGLAEYALILALVAMVVIGILTLIGPAIGSIFSNIKHTL